MAEKVTKSEAEWRQQLGAERYEVCRNKGTEPAFAGSYHDCKDPGIYRCSGCGAELFDSDDKFDSGTGWPSFTTPIEASRVESHEDLSHGMRRAEVTCGRCDSHLGHVFPDGPAPNRQRYCINSVSLDLERREED